MKSIFKVCAAWVLAVTIAFGVFHSNANAYTVPTVIRLADNKVGRSQSAGITDVSVTLATGVEFTQHFHCNEWTESTRSFTSLTGTFFNLKPNSTSAPGTTRYHYTISTTGKGWDIEPPYAKIAMETRTQQKLDALITP